MRKFYSFIVLGGFIFSGCSLPQMIKLAKDQKLEVVPNPLEVHKDTVTYDVSANLPVKMLKKGTSYTLNSFYTYAGKEMALEPIVFKGDDFPAAATQQPRLSKKFTFPYKEDYRVGAVEIQGVAAKGTKTKATERLPIANGIITTSRLVQNAYYAAFADHGYNNHEEIIPIIIPDFIFEQGRSVLRTSEIKSDRGKQLDAFIAAKNVTRTVTITGTHSPEGAERINSKLANERAAAIEKYYRAQMKKYDYQQKADEIKFIQKPVIDDWTEFKTALGTYNGISAEEKNAYLNIVNSPSTFEQQEKELQKLKTYKKVFKEIYPGLRTAKTEILTIKVKKTDPEISILAKQISKGEIGSDALSFEELMYGATLTPSLEEKASIYEAATKKGTNWNAHNNLGAAYIALAIQNPARAGELAEKAGVQLELAARIRQTPEVHANLATVSLMRGNPYKAASHAAKALNGANNEVTRGVNGVKGACEIYMAKYGDAVRSTTSANTSAINLFNKGLAQLLSKDYANAGSSFSEAVRLNANLAVAHYAAAVASVRAGNTDGAIASLSNAVRIDPTLKEKALTDVEFTKISTTDSFRNALK